MATVITSLVRKKQVIPNLRTWHPGDPLKEVDQYLTLVKGDNNHYYLVSSLFTPDHGYETMVFERNSAGENVDWQDFYCEQYETEDEMISGHKNVVDRIDDLV